jgi:hypothetical protein
VGHVARIRDIGNAYTILVQKLKDETNLWVDGRIIHNFSSKTKR